VKHLGDLLFPFVVTLVSDQIPFDPPSMGPPIDDKLIEELGGYRALIK